MSDRGPSPAGSAEHHRMCRARPVRWLAAALALAMLAGCEHGDLSFNRDTGQFSVPIGAGSKENR